MENSTTLTSVSDGEIAWFPALYTGADELAGTIPNADGYVQGVYWESDEGLVLFESNNKIFEVSDEDVRRTPLSTSAVN